MMCVCVCVCVNRELMGGVHCVSMVTGHCVHGERGDREGIRTVHTGRPTGRCHRDGTKVVTSWSVFFYAMGS